MMEILAPAGNLQCANAAIDNGADAVYLGLNAFSARQGAENFDGASFCTVLRKAHLCGVKVYVAMNTLVKDEELEGFLKNLLFVWNEGADAVILQDAFLGKYVHELYPDIVLHLSTQAGVCTLDGAKFAKTCGFSRIILARETPLDEIEKIATFIETEVFVQGALCTCFSGQCYFSSFVGGNSGNRGRCKQPCRKRYAYDRKGYEGKEYALSLSDLCVGEEIQKYIDAGVISFKIEGRMRRAEYVAATVRYYRALLDGNGNTDATLSDLKRTYNRGNYTKGLAFGQDKRFLSPIVQGHLGEKVGVVKVNGGNYCVESRFQPVRGDAFKILREGKEIGGAMYGKTLGKYFTILSKTRLKNGDSVFITTDMQVNTRVLQAKRKVQWNIRLYFVENKRAIAQWKDVCVSSSFILQTAKNRALTIEELKTCFTKTDALPVEITFDEIELQGDIFLPKSELNAFRREFYSKVTEEILRKKRATYKELSLEFPAFHGKNGKTAVISNDFTGISVDVAIYKPQDYRLPLPENFINGNFEKFLYYPAFATSTDLKLLEKRLTETQIDGIYVENYGGITFANEHNLQVFAGTGLNLYNRFSVEQFMAQENAVYYAISKELNMSEAFPLLSERAFALSSGDIKLMDLCYCPFEKTCSRCDKKSIYSLTDENGRVFPVRRYLAADGNCRFEVYNCASLVGRGLSGAGKLCDLSITNNKISAVSAIEEETLQKQVYQEYTSGHWKRGVL